VESWKILFQILVLLGAATLLGLAVQRFRQNAIIGYLLAGVLLGPGAFAVVESSAAVVLVAELGVALLLFTIGLEFSLSHLRALGGAVAVLGVLQITVTCAVAGALADWFALEPLQALIAGIAVAMSSTSVVLRLLSEQSELDSSHGRSSVGILLLQDLAIIPAMLLITAAGQTGALGGFFLSLLKGLALVAVIYALIRWVFPAVMTGAASARNREIPILLSITICLGCSYASHALGLSPVLGSFAAGILLAESPFADQVRADVVPLRAAFLTLFFSSIGMFAVFPGRGQWPAQLALVLGILILKTVIIVALSLLVRRPLATAIRTGIILAQTGEFSFVILDIAFRQDLLTADIYQPLLTASVVTLLLTPLMIQHSHRFAALGVSIASRFTSLLPPSVASPAEARRNHVIVIGYGPAGRKVVEQLRLHGASILVLELNPNLPAADVEGISLHYGDATQADILEHAAPAEARAVIVTIPDPQAAALMIRQLRELAPHTPIIARVRYNIFEARIAEAGADHLVNEEVLVGQQLAEETLSVLDIAPRV